jgi:hypothetical protein
MGTRTGHDEFKWGTGQPLRQSSAIGMDDGCTENTA